MTTSDDALERRFIAAQQGKTPEEIWGPESEREAIARKARDRVQELLDTWKPYPCPKCGGDMDLVTLDHVVCEDCGHDLGGDQQKGLE